MTFPRTRSTTGAPEASTDRRSRGRVLVVVAALAVALASCGVDAGDAAAPTSGDEAAATTAAPTTTEATATTEADGPGGVGGVTGGEGDQGGSSDEGSGSGQGGTSSLSVEEISQMFQQAGFAKEEADCIAEAVHDADLSLDDITEFTESEDADTTAGQVLTDAFEQCFDLGG